MEQAPEPRRHRPISVSERAEIYRMADEGVPYRTIAEALNRPIGTISNLVSNGILEGKVTRRHTRLENRKA